MNNNSEQQNIHSQNDTSSLLISPQTNGNNNNSNNNSNYNATSSTVSSQPAITSNINNCNTITGPDGINTNIDLSGLPDLKIRIKPPQHNGNSMMPPSITQTDDGCTNYNGSNTGTGTGTQSVIISHVQHNNIPEPIKPPKPNPNLNPNIITIKTDINQNENIIKSRNLSTEMAAAQKNLDVINAEKNINIYVI